MAHPWTRVRAAVPRLVPLGLGWMAIWGCAAAAPSSSAPAADIAASRVKSESTSGRPRLVLVEREGDPERGLALAVHVGASPRVAAGLALLASSRLRASGFPDTQVHPGASGFVAHALARREDEVPRFVEAAHRALTTPVEASEAEQVAARYRAAPPPVAGSASELAVARCSGELLVAADEADASSVARDLPGWLEGVRSGDVALAVIGPRGLLDSARRALDALPDWARRGVAPALPAPDDATGLALRASGPGSLTLALSGLPEATAISAAQRLGRPDSLLGVRVAASHPPMRLARVASHSDRSGTCLRVDLETRGPDAAAPGLALTAARALDEIRHALVEPPAGEWLLAKQVLGLESPRDAAAVAAWRAVHSRVREPARQTRLIHFSGPLQGTPSAAEFEALLEAALDRDASLEHRWAVEAGQGQFWMLAASPCGTAEEDAESAGTLALSLRTAAAAHTGDYGVIIEPWLTPDAMGLLAHAGPEGHLESPSTQALRVAEALARALLGDDTPDVLAAVRGQLLEELGAVPRPGFELALARASANHPSWLDPRGTWSSLSSLPASSVLLRRQAFVRGRLRVASLGNHDETQVREASSRFARIVDVGRGPRAACPAPVSVRPQAGRYRISTSAPREPDAIIAVPWPPSGPALAPETLWTETLMNRPNGWLSRALLKPGLVSAARAQAVGGGRAAALLIEIHAVDGMREEAVAQVRGLLGRLRAGAASRDDARAAQRELGLREAQRRLDPRGRIVDLWHGGRRTEGSLSALRKLHRAAFEPGREVVVLVDPR